jgi:hypothetical protein
MQFDTLLKMYFSCTGHDMLLVIGLLQKVLAIKYDQNQMIAVVSFYQDCHQSGSNEGSIEI